MAKLNNRQLNNMLKEAFSDAAPDKAEQIVRAAAGNNRAPTYSIVQEDFKRKYIRNAALIAAALVVIVGVVLTLTLVRTNTPYATITVESDECVEITLNRDLRPIGISGRNSAALRLARQAGDCNSVDEAIDGVLDAMLDNGNLGEKSNTVLITVDAPEDEEALLDQSFDAARSSFRNSCFRGAILTAVASDDADITRLASRHRISVGKAEMVTDILRAERNFSTDNLCRLSVNDLNLLSSYRRILYTHIDVYGESCGCITQRDARLSAFEDLGIPENDAVVTLGADRYGLIYSVTIHAPDGIYIYRLSAMSGEILAVSKGSTPQIAQMADNNTPSPPPTEKKTESATKATENSRAPQNSRTVITDLTQDPAPAASAAPNVVTNPNAAGSGDRPASTEAKTPTPPPARPTPTSAPATQKPPAAPQPETSPPAPTDPPKRDPAIFTAPNYLAYTAGLQSGSPLTSSARQISLNRIVNGYDLYYDSSSFPYTPTGVQGGITALVCSTEQFRRLVGRDDSRFDDAYFATRALYVHLNRDADYHWIKSIQAAYTDGGRLCLYNSEPIGYYVNESGRPERVYTVIYELNKSDLAEVESIVEFCD